MEALKLAFDLVIVGALALPWLAFALKLFTCTPLREMWGKLKSEKDSINPAFAGVLLFTMAYFLGAAICRVSEDFFNDEDLQVPITEDHIRTAVVCSEDERLLRNKIAELDQRLINVSGDCHNPRLISQIFNLEESDLLLQGADKTDRLNQLRSQMAVLRGAAFDGMVLFMLCIFGLCAMQTGWIRVAFSVIPLALLTSGVLLLWRHYFHHGAEDPPFMEYTLIVLGMAAAYLLYHRAPGSAKTYVTGLVLASLFTWLAAFGWWWTEVRYDQQVTHSFYAQNLFPGTK